ncbi:MAG: P-type DNA transfer ATPase VirB11 [Sulfurimonas sp.]|jgi:type IV secretion system protein VirB11|uniref:P-type DNA transfer ATPase VirB11 n=1 Tax=Sulfurimonas sp. TaxID=2022749 RepID=UPI0035646353
MSRSLAKYADDFFKHYLSNDDINEICYNGGETLWLQDAYAKWHEEKTILDLNKALAFGTACASHKQDQLQANKPILSAVLPTGERVQVVIPPVTKKDMISITIRKPSKIHYKIDDYDKDGLFSKIIHETKNKHTPYDIELKEYYDKGKYKDFITQAVNFGKNIIIAGATGSGKTTFMKSLIDFIPKSERIITIEDVEEIKFYKHKNYVQLFYPSEAKEGDAITPASLLKSCMRMKPDRILLAELRGAETYDFLNVINSGHGGSLTSLHAGSVSETFTRLALMTLQNPQGQKIPFEVIQKNLKETIDIVVHFHAHDGKRVITDIYYKGA